MESWIDLILTLAVGGYTLFKVGAWLISKRVDVIAAKAGEILEKVADGLESGAVIAEGFGFVRVADILDEAADVPDELGDVCTKFADMVANDKFTKDTVLDLVNEGKEVGIEGKDFWVKIVKKPE